MAEESDLEKTEPASSRRIEQAREEGNVPQSRELTAFMVLAAGTGTLGDEPEKFWADHKGAGVNSIRTQTLIRDADVVVVRFGEKYRQWNAAFDAGYAAALGKPYITEHPEEFDHALKEVDGAARATARSPEQVAAVLRYVMEGEIG